MKKFFFLACVMLSALLTFAQETKKVAILEVVDKEGNISYANKLILRSNLAKAITNTPGYEAYDRTDMDAILGEQNFQRTGMVSNDQIKRLGEMTGAQYVLVAEAALVDDITMYITAKLLDVETARTEMTDNQMMGKTAKEIQRGCQLLAEKLIKPAVTSTSAVLITRQEKTEKHEKYEKQGNNAIVKISRNEYRINGNVMDKKAYENFIYQNCPASWKKYKNGKNAIIAGWTLFAVGVAMQPGWAMFPIGYNNRDTGLLEAGIGVGAAGCCLAGIGFLTFIGGYVSRETAINTYNKKCASATPLTLNLTAGQNGLGLALTF